MEYVYKYYIFMLNFPTHVTLIYEFGFIYMSMFIVQTKIYIVLNFEQNIIQQSIQILIY